MRLQDDVYFQAESRRAEGSVLTSIRRDVVLISSSFDGMHLIVGIRGLG
jgi:hypothetical protein